MRFRLLGYTGERPPVPVAPVVGPEDPPDEPPVDPGEFTPPDPLILVLNDGDVFHKADYLALGYNRFDVMAIGAAGGRGYSYGVVSHDGPVDPTVQPTYRDFEKVGPPDAFSAGVLRATGPTTLQPHYETSLRGGGGGGGGAHRIRGRLALLPANVPVVVGAAGADATVPGNDGADGGYSSFGGVICRASGGKGGKHFVLAPGVSLRYADGGEGGVGNSDVAGGGAEPNVGSGVGAHGSWDGVIGKGGAGGGRVGTNAGWGGDGSKDTDDPLTKGPGDLAGHESLLLQQLTISKSRIDGTISPMPWMPGGWGNWRETYGLVNTYVDTISTPGFGGGAKTFLINGDNLQWGSKADGRPGTGRVVIKLTYVIT